MDPSAHTTIGPLRQTMTKGLASFAAWAYEVVDACQRRQELQQNQAALRHQRQALDGQADDGAIARAEALCREAEAAVELSRRRLG